MNEPASSGSSPAPLPLTLDLTAPALAEAADAQNWLLFAQGEQAAERFYAALTRELADLCQSVAERLAGTIGGLGRLPTPDGAASLHFSRPVFQHRFTTGPKQRRKRGSSAGLWRVFYALSDKDGDGRPDTLSVLALRHGAAAPFSAVPETDEPGEGEGQP